MDNSRLLHIITLCGNTAFYIEFAIWYRTLVPSHLQLRLNINRFQGNKCFFVFDLVSGMTKEQILDFLVESQADPRNDSGG